MSLLGGALVAAGSGLVNSALNVWQANHAAHQNQRYAQHQMDWQEEMSNTAHQREIADLRAAGVNPIMTAMGGSGASTPTGQSGSIAQAYASDFASAREMYKYLNSQKDNIEADTSAKKEAAKTEVETQRKLKQETLESASRTGLNNNEYNYQLATMPSLAETVNSSNAVQRLMNRIQSEHYDSSIGRGAKAAGYVLSDLLPIIQSGSHLAREAANIQNLRSYNPTYHNYKK